MTLDEYNEAVSGIVAAQQEIAQATMQLAMKGHAYLGNPEFTRLLQQQGGLLQQLTQLNTQMVLGVMVPPAMRP